MFTITFLILLIFGNILSAIAGNITYKYKVLNIKGSIARRADISFYCPHTIASIGSYLLIIKPKKDRILVSITFHGEDIEVKQDLKVGQRITEGKLKELDSKDTSSIKFVPFKNGTFKLTNLKNGNYKFSYYIIVSSQNKSIDFPIINSSNNSNFLREGSLISFKVPIFFSPGSFSLDEKAKLTLKFLKNLKNKCDIQIIGYSDSTKIVKSKVKSNSLLAKLRALSVKNYLEK